MNFAASGRALIQQETWALKLTVEMLGLGFESCNGCRGAGTLVLSLILGRNEAALSRCLGHSLELEWRGSICSYQLNI